jgi:dipeptidyl aminopeptidase/acylaminoacyl peptidase
LKPHASCYATKSVTATAFQVAKSNAPILIAFGMADTTVSIAQAQELYDKLHQAGVPATLAKVDDGHTFATPEARRRLAFESLKFFQRYLTANP